MEYLNNPEFMKKVAICVVVLYGLYVFNNSVTTESFNAFINPDSKYVAERCAKRTEELKEINNIEHALKEASKTADYVDHNNNAIRSRLYQDMQIYEDQNSWCEDQGLNKNVMNGYMVYSNNPSNELLRKRGKELNVTGHLLNTLHNESNVNFPETLNIPELNIPTTVGETIALTNKPLHKNKLDKEHEDIVLPVPDQNSGAVTQPTTTDTKENFVAFAG